MKGKSLALLVLALGCGLVASIGITQVLAKRGETPPPSDLVPVYVAKSDIAIGDPINEDNTKVEQWPKDKVPAGSLARPEDVDGRHARQKIYAGEPVIEPKLLARGQVPTDSMVPKGLRVVAITVSPEATHSGLVLPGTRCDLQVFIRADGGSGVGETMCKTILQDIRVFAVNDATSTETHDPKNPELHSIQGRTVSLLVTPTQAEIVTLASQMGSIKLILRSSEDSEQPKTDPMTVHEMLGAAGGGDRKVENVADVHEKKFLEWADSIRKQLQENAKDPAKAREPDPAQHFTMRVRAGTDVNDVVLISNSPLQGLDDGVWTPVGQAPNPRPKPIDARPAATPSKASGGPVLVPAVTPGSPRSPDGPYVSPTAPQPPSG